MDSGSSSPLIPEVVRNRSMHVLAIGEGGAAMAVLFLIPILVVYFQVELPGWGASGAALSAGIGMILAWLFFFKAWSFSRPWGTGRFRIPSLPIILAIGLFLQGAAALLTSPVQQSDMEIYLALAEKLARGMDYVDGGGRQAFWPLGLPLFLAPFVFVLGADREAITVANAVLYLIGAWSVWSLTKAAFGEPAALIASLLFTVWPSRLLLAGLAAKELLTLTMVAASVALAIDAFSERARHPRTAALLAGAAMGAAALTQPGLLLLLFAYPVMLRAFLGEMRGGRLSMLFGAIALGASLVVAPWMIRNCEVFSGEFCGLATNGGSVFYRANNPAATGLWIPEGEVPITHLPELEQNRLGFELGRQWIREHPGDAVKLAARKVMFFLGGDAHGAYWAIERGAPEGGVPPGSGSRRMQYLGAELLSNLFWVAIAGLAFRALRERARSSPSGMPLLLPFVYPLLYGVAVFAVFESGDRQHMFAVPPLLALAASRLAPGPAPLRAPGAP